MFTPAGISAQDTTGSLPLLNILVDLQERYGYHFNYASEAIENIELAPPNHSLPLNEIIEYLQQETGLLFTALPNNFISIKPQAPKLCGYIKDKIFNNKERVLLSEPEKNAEKIGQILVNKLSGDIDEVYEDRIHTIAGMVKFPRARLASSYFDAPEGSRGAVGFDGVRRLVFFSRAA